jgi:hypothetical protein
VSSLSRTILTVVVAIFLAVLPILFLVFPDVRTAMGLLLGEQAANAVTVVSGSIAVCAAFIALLRWVRESDERSRQLESAPAGARVLISRRR